MVEPRFLILQLQVSVPLDDPSTQTANPSTCCQSNADTNRQRIELMNVQREIVSALASQNQSLREVLNLLQSQAEQEDPPRPRDAPPAYAGPNPVDPNPAAPVEANVVIRNQNFNADNATEHEYE